MRCLPSQPALKRGHGPTPSTQRVPPRTLKQWVEMQRSRDCEESILRASGRKKIPHCLESWSVVPSVLAAAIQAVVSRLMAAGARTSLVLWQGAVCNSSLAPGCPVTQPFNTFLLCLSVSFCCLLLLDQGSRNLGSQMSPFSTNPC